MDLPAAASNGSHHQPKLSAWGGEGVDGSINNGQEQNGRVASSQCKIAAAHNAQMGELCRCICLPSFEVLGLATPRLPEKNEREDDQSW